MKEFCQIIISTPSKEEADKISNSLITKKLVAGSLIIHGPSRYWWEGKIVDKEYFNVQAFSLIKNKDKIIEDVKKNHSDKCPVIAFLEIDGNKEFLDWVKEVVK